MVEFQQPTRTVDEGGASEMTPVDVCLELTLNGNTLAREVEAQITVNGGTASENSNSVVR